MTDAELSTALRAYSEACYEARFDPERRGPGSVPTGEERFLKQYGEERGPKLLERVQALWQEARQVRDPGGPLANYAKELDAWVATHPEVERRELREIVNQLLWASR